MDSEHRLDNVAVEIACELGRQEMTLKEVRRLRAQDVVVLDRLAGEATEVRVNGRLFALGEIVVVTDRMAVRLTRLVDVPQEMGP